MQYIPRPQLRKKILVLKKSEHKYEVSIAVKIGTSTPVEVNLQMVFKKVFSDQLLRKSPIFGGKLVHSGTLTSFLETLIFHYL